MSAIEWMFRHGDAMDHAIAVQWRMLPETTEGDIKRKNLFESWSVRFLNADVQARLMK